MSAPIDAQLVGRAAGRDPEAVERLFVQVRPRVLRYCRARLGWLSGGYTTADDVTQDVCLALLRALPTYQDQSRPFAAFVYTIAARKVADVYRRASKTFAVGDLLEGTADQAAGPEEQAIAADINRRMGRLLDRLPPHQREIIVLRVAVRMSADEVGGILGMNAGAVRVAQSRAMKRLRELAAGHAGELR